MIVPRAFQHRRGATSPTPARRSSPTKRSQESHPEKVSAPSQVWRPEPVSRAAPSQPILIRTRPSSHTRHVRSSRETLRPPPTSQPSSTRDHATVSRAQKPSGSVFTTDEDIEEVESHPLTWRRERAIRQQSPAQPLSTSSPKSWELLQTPFDPARLEDDGASFDSDATESPFSSPYSFSSASIDLTESEKGRLTPSRKRLEVLKRRPRQKSLSSSFTEDCGPDHPLSPQGDASGVLEDLADDDLGHPHTLPPNPEAKSFLASNLSASIRILKSAAKSFSGLSAARRQQLTRSILSISPQFTDEKRPVLYDEVPEPALRRYFNPCHVSPSEFHFQTSYPLQNAATERCTISVQLQSYYRAPSPSKHATTPAIFPGGGGTTRSAEEEAELPEASSSSAAVRQREPRENGDFLRIIVLEMNMRKAGKLSDTPSGKARIWLPPRQVSTPAGTALVNNSVPERWVETVT